MRRRATYPLDRAVRFQSLVVGRRSGRLYVSGSTPLRGPCAPSPCTSTAMVDVLDAGTGHLATSWVVHPAYGRPGSCTRPRSHPTRGSYLSAITVPIQLDSTGSPWQVGVCGAALARQPSLDARIAAASSSTAVSCNRAAGSLQQPATGPLSTSIAMACATMEHARDRQPSR